MFRFNLFKTPKHQEFIYIPRYYDPEKEELEERIKAARGDKNVSIEGMKSRIGATYRERSKKHKQKARKEIRSSNIRLLVIFAVLLFLSYILLIKFLPFLEAYLE